MRDSCVRFIGAYSFPFLLFSRHIPSALTSLSVFLPWNGKLLTVDRNGMCRDLADDGILRVIYPGYDNLFETDMGNWNDEVRGEEGKH